MKAYRGVDVYVHIFLTSALAGGEWSASRPGRFISGERAVGTHFVGGWVDPRAGLNDVEKIKFFTLPGLELDPSVVHPVASRYTDYAIPAPVIKIYKIFKLLLFIFVNFNIILILIFYIHL
jgi:hypothetical protein